jgi:hypothetical protein
MFFNRRLSAFHRKVYLTGARLSFDALLLPLQVFRTIQMCRAVLPYLLFSILFKIVGQSCQIPFQHSQATRN